MPNKRKRISNPNYKLKYQTHPQKLERKKRARVEKEKAVRKKWATDKKYLKRQAEKGYVRVGGKWVKQFTTSIQLENKDGK